MSISADQAKAARKGLGLNQEEVALLAQMPVCVLAEFERGMRPSEPADRGAIQAALEARGALFTPDNGICFSWAAMTVGKTVKGLTGHH